MYKVTKRDCPMFGIGPYVCEFICDTASDISTLPTSISEGTGGRTAYDNQICGSGSTATIVANDMASKKYILNNQDVWCPQSLDGTGSNQDLSEYAKKSDLDSKADASHTHSASDVGADTKGSAAAALSEAKTYTDNAVADLINGAPTTRDTLKEISDLMDENASVVEALDAAIGAKANKTDIPTKTSELENDSGFLTEHQDLSGYAKNTDIPTALPADGGNADTLDGLHSGSFALKTEIPTSLPANGGNADTIASVPINDIFISKTLQGISDIDNTDGNWSVGIVPSWENVSGTFPNNCPMWVVINQYMIFPDHFVIQICHGVADNRIWMRGKHVTGSWGNWGDIYSLDNKPYVTGIATNVINENIDQEYYYSYHGFQPSAVFYIVPNQMTTGRNQIYSAKNFDTEKFHCPQVTGGNGSNLREISYIMFK